jgi:neutral ceramidase
VIRLAMAAALVASTMAAAGYKAGVARAVITPEKPIYMSGYANRKHASEGVVHDLWAKALAIEDSKGGRVVLVTTDLIGLPRWLSEVVGARVEKEYGLDRARLVLNSSHTHTGPLIKGNLEMMFELQPGERQVVDEFAQKLADMLVSLVGMALKDLSPANVSLGHGQAGFAVNRREPTPKGIRLGVNPSGPTDHDVPVLKITAPDGRLRAVVFGYACHNTTLGGDFYQIVGDYAGYAQIGVEKVNPSVTAMFLQLCGADQNPNPRGKLEIAEQHGAALAAEVNRVLGGRLVRVRGAVQAIYQTTELGFAPHTRATFEARLTDSNVWRVRHAREMLRLYDEGRPIRRYPLYPVQAVRFGKSLTLVALGGEVVVDYALRLKKEYGAKDLIVAGYSNDVMSYIPSLAVLKGGGYEAVDSMIYYGRPGPYNEEVEDRIFTTIHHVMQRVGRKPAK